MVTKWNKLYDPEAYSTAYKVFSSNAMTLTFDLKILYSFSIHKGDQVCQVVQSWNLQFDLSYLEYFSTK